VNCMCGATSAGLVMSRPLGGIEDEYAASPVCALPACIEEASKWVTRVTFGKAAFHVPNEGEQ
jgi:hypothetical protein